MRFASVPVFAVATTVLLVASPTIAAPGDLDSTFGPAGQVTTKMGTLDSGAAAVAMQGNKIVVGGTATRKDEDFGLVRYLSNGKRDRSFGRRGRAFVDLGDEERLQDIAILPNRKILVAGTTNGKGLSSRMGIVRLTRDGKIDRRFGRDGWVKTSFGDLGAFGRSIVAMADGKFAVGGATGDPGGLSFAVARYLANGRLDDAFDGDGRAVVPFFGGSEWAEISDLVDWNGFLLAAGTTSGAGTYDVALARFREDGSLDPYFGGGDGITVEDLGGTDLLDQAVLLNDGDFVIGGYTDAASNEDAAFLRFNPSGHVDSAWGGGDGLVTYDLGGPATEYWFDLARSGSGVVAAGEVGGRAAFFRILDDGTGDPTFGFNGLVVWPFSGGQSRIIALAIQADDKIVGAGQASATQTHQGFGVTRLMGP